MTKRTLRCFQLGCPVEFDIPMPGEDWSGDKPHEAHSVVGYNAYLQHVNSCKGVSAFTSLDEHSQLFHVRLHHPSNMVACGPAHAEPTGYPEPPACFADVTPAMRAILCRGGPSYALSHTDADHIVDVDPSLRLYLGSEAAARHPGQLQALGVRAIINCAYNSIPLEQPQLDSCGVSFYRRLDLADVPEGQDNSIMILQGADAVAQAVEALQAATETAEGAQQYGQEGNAPAGILVHCVAGVSRSSSVVIAYLVEHRGYSLHAAASLVKAARPVAYPNYGFWQALRTIEISSSQDGVSTVPEEVLNALHWRHRMPLDTFRLRTYREDAEGQSGKAAEVAAAAIRQGNIYPGLSNLCESPSTSARQTLAAQRMASKAKPVQLARMDKVRQRLNAAEGKPEEVDAKASKRESEEDIKEPITEEEQQQMFRRMVAEHAYMVDQWRFGFNFLPLTVGASVAFMLWRHSVQPWQGEAQHFVPFKNQLNEGAIGFGLAITILVCVLSLLWNNFPRLSAVRVATSILSLIPGLIFGWPFLELKFLSQFYQLLWTPLAAPVVAWTQLGVEYLWGRMGTELVSFWENYNYKHKGA